jgi:hypothetical protein
MNTMTHFTWLTVILGRDSGPESWFRELNHRVTARA